MSAEWVEDQSVRGKNTREKIGLSTGKGRVGVPGTGGFEYREGLSTGVGTEFERSRR